MLQSADPWCYTALGFILCWLFFFPWKTGEDVPLDLPLRQQLCPLFQNWLVVQSFCQSSKCCAELNAYVTHCKRDQEQPQGIKASILITHKHPVCVCALVSECMVGFLWLLARLGHSNPEHFLNIHLLLIVWWAKKECCRTHQSFWHWGLVAGR